MRKPIVYDIRKVRGTHTSDSTVRELYAMINKEDALIVPTFYNEELIIKGNTIQLRQHFGELPSIYLFNKKFGHMRILNGNVLSRIDGDSSGLCELQAWFKHNGRYLMLPVIDGSFCIFDKNDNSIDIFDAEGRSVEEPYYVTDEELNDAQNELIKKLDDKYFEKNYVVIEDNQISGIYILSGKHTFYRDSMDHFYEVFDEVIPTIEPTIGYPIKMFK